MVENIEEEARAKLLRDRIRKYDFALTLPGNLRNRVAKIIEYEFDDFDDTVFITQSEAETPVSFGDDDQDEEEKQVEKKKASKSLKSQQFCLKLIPQIALQLCLGLNHLITA